MALRALIFDVDGTLANTERDGHRPAFNAAFAELGLPWHWDVDLFSNEGRVVDVDSLRLEIALSGNIFEKKTP